MRFVFPIFFLSIAMVLGRPIEIEVSRGRNMNAVKLVDQAQDQLFNKNDVAGALKSANAAIQSDPNYWPALYVRADVLIEQHQYAAAIRDCNAILQQDSTVVEAALLRADANYHLGNCAAALKEVEHCVTIHPRQDAWARAYNMRAFLHLFCRDPSIRNLPKALADAKTACKLMAWSDGDLIDTLAMAEAATGDFESAAKHEREAIGATKAREDEKRQYERHLGLFQQHKLLDGTSR